MIKLIKLEDIPETPWKNNLGKTRQIAIFPRGATVINNDFLWRLSSAAVNGRAPFSQFPESDRLLVVWKGDGLLLNNQKLLPNSPLHFSGSAEIDCDLINNPVIDLGLIYKRDKISASMDILAVDKKMRVELDSGIHFFFLADGECLVNNMKLASGDLIEVENESELDFSPNSPSLFYRILIKVL